MKSFFILLAINIYSLLTSSPIDGIGAAICKLSESKARKEEESRRVPKHYTYYLESKRLQYIENLEKKINRYFWFLHNNFMETINPESKIYKEVSILEKLGCVRRNKKNFYGKVNICLV